MGNKQVYALLVGHVDAYIKSSGGWLAILNRLRVGILRIVFLRLKIEFAWFPI